nr:putative uncharacterized protein DDB_G0286901 isoform X1 [Osmia lignaria]
MQGLCPLCLKNGLKKKIKLLQINLQEAIWMCEEEKCVWPFGCEDFTFCQRLVGKIWSCYWDDNIPPKLKENLILPVKPSIIPIKDPPKECISSILDLSPSDNNLNISVKEESNIVLQINTEEKYNLNNKIITPSLNDNNLQSSSNKIKTERTENSLNKHIKKEIDVFTENIKSINNVKGIPKVTSIEKTIIDISNVKTENQISVNQDQNKNILSNNVNTNTVEHNLSLPLNDKIQTIPDSSDYKELPKLGPSKNVQLLNEVTAKSNLNVTTMQLDGLPPITLAFEMPVSTTVPEIVTSNVRQNDCKRIVTECLTKPITLDMESVSSKRNVTSGKQYEKFSFSALKKKKEINNSTNASSNSNSFQNVKPKLETKNVANNSIANVKKRSCTENFHDIQSIASYNKNFKPITSVTDVTDTSKLNQVNNYESSLPNQDVSNNEETISDTSTSTAINIDTVLTDFLTNDYNVSEDINDEWLNSLLS